MIVEAGYFKANAWHEWSVSDTDTQPANERHCIKKRLYADRENSPKFSMGKGLG